MLITPSLSMHYNTKKFQEVTGGKCLVGSVWWEVSSGKCLAELIMSSEKE